MRRLVSALFYAFTLKPLLGLGIALYLGGYWVENAEGMPRAAPEVASAVLLALAVKCRGALFLSRVWSWIVLLSSCGFASRAFADSGLWSPTLWPLIALPVGILAFSGAAWDLLCSWSPLLRWGAVGVVLGVLPIPFLFWPQMVAGQVYIEATFAYGGFLLAAVAGSILFNLRTSDYGIKKSGSAIHG